jgi:pyridoxamine 5'-phosphate oxidase
LILPALLLGKAMSVQHQQLDANELGPDPFLAFEKWFTAANDTDIADPNAMSLATSADNEVSVRTVLMKYWDAEGFVFFTNYESRKAQQIATNPLVGLLFYWECLRRQVRIEGVATRISMAESLKYFATRPRGSQLGAWCSSQSSVISSRDVLNAKLEEIKRKFSNRQVPLPSMWGGYRVVPRRIEFWQLGQDRLHDRFLFERLDGDAAWSLNRLAP